jgi:hypothetical protein
MEIGFDHDGDRARAMTVSEEEGIVVVEKEADLTRKGTVFVAEGAETRE